VWLAMVLAVSPALAAGKVLVSNDEWPLSDYGYRLAPDAERFALNVADFFTGGGRPGRFLVYSTNWGLTGDRLAATMRGAGHAWTVKNPAAAPPEDFGQGDTVQHVRRQRQPAPHLERPAQRHRLRHHRGEQRQPRRQQPAATGRPPEHRARERAARGRHLRPVPRHPGRPSGRAVPVRFAE